MSRAFTIFMLMLGVACTEMKPPKKVNYYYNLDSLLDHQAQLLTPHRLIKTAYVDDDTASVSLQGDSTLWNDELAIFRGANINKPAYEGMYTTQVVEDSLSNLHIKTFTATTQDLEVRNLHLFYLRDLNNLRKVKALIREKNPIYKSGKSVTLTLDELRDELIITGYTIEGYQKMILQDSVAFIIKGAVQVQ